MQFKKETLAEIAAKRVNLAFRRWKRPSVKAHDVISTPIGDLTVVSCEKTAIAKISAADLKRAGYSSRSALLREFANHPGDVYRIVLRPKPAELPPRRQRHQVSLDQSQHRNSAAKTGPSAGSRSFAFDAHTRAATGCSPDANVRLCACPEKSSRQPPAPAKSDEKITKAELKSAIAALKTLDQSSGHGAWTATTLRLIDKYPARRAPDLAASQRRDPLVFTRDVLRLKQLGLTENLEVGYRLSPRGPRHPRGSVVGFPAQAGGASERRLCANPSLRSPAHLTSRGRPRACCHVYSPWCAPLGWRDRSSRSFHALLAGLGPVSTSPYLSGDTSRGRLCMRL